MTLSSHVRSCAVLVALVAFIASSAPLAATASGGEPPAPSISGGHGAESASSQEPRSHIAPAAPDPAPASRAQGAAQAAATAPARVTGVKVSQLTSTTAHVFWTAPANGGSSITGYSLRLLQGGAVIDEARWNAASTAAEISALQADTAYEFQVAAINAVGTGEFSSPLRFTTLHSSVDRIFGATRYETAVKVAEDAFVQDDVQAAFIASGRDFPDALAAAAAGGTFGGPVLLTQPTSLPAGVLSELKSMKPQFVFAAGGASVVSNKVFNAAAATATDGSFRYGGKNRYDTAAQVSTLWKGHEPKTVFLASGTNFPDALAGAAAAGYTGAPVLLTQPNSLPAETAAALRALAPTKIIALGGSGALSNAVLKSARLATKVSTTTTRWGGANRYETANAVAKHAFTKPRVPVIYIANGTNFPDALAGAAASGFLGGPVLLTQPGSIPSTTLAQIKRLDPVRVVVLGGPTVIKNSVVEQIQKAVR